MFGLSSLRLGIYAVCAVAIIAGLFKLHDSIGDAREVKVRAEYAKAIERQKQKTRDAEQKARDISEKTDRDYLEQKASLQSRIDYLLSRPERVRIVTRSAPASGVPETASELKSEASRARPDMRISDDPTDELVRYAGRCEADREQVIKLQEWIAAQSLTWGQLHQTPQR